jgi:hypothetical protein
LFPVLFNILPGWCLNLIIPEKLGETISNKNIRNNLNINIFEDTLRMKRE